MVPINPWETEEGKQVWKTEATYWSYVRGALRRLWSDYPLRKVWKNSQLRPLTLEEKASGTYHPSTKKVGQCSFCKGWFAGSKLEVDHIEQSDGCTSKTTAESFLWHCLGRVGVDFRLACKPCHKIQSHAQRVGLDFESARVEKEIIELQKTKKDKEFLSSKGVIPSPNKDKRKLQLREVLSAIRNKS